MTIRIGINGLGRIGRCVVRALYESGADDIELVAVNGPAPIDTHIHLLSYDSVHGRFSKEVKAKGENLLIDGNEVKLFHDRDPKNIPWGELGVDIVLECTGKFNNKEDASQHLASGAKKILVSAPAKDVDSTIVYGVNNDALKAEHTVASVGSCTTNCLAPLVKVLHEKFGLTNGFMTTIHSYTGDQNLVDGSHKDMRRARGAAQSIIPTSTGAAKTIGVIIPQLQGKLDGVAIRVPTANVSMVDLAFTTEKPATVETINLALSDAANSSLKGVLDVSDKPLVSIDYTHTPHSSIADVTGTKVLDGGLCRVAAWYDNEWAFSLRMLDVTRLWATL